MAINGLRISRGEFLRLGLAGGAAAAAGVMLFPDAFFPGAWAQAPGAPELLVVVFLRGGCDGLNFVCPLSGEDRKIYEQERPTINMPLSGVDALLTLDERFGLHPKAKSFHKFFREKRLAVIHSAGLPANTRSHFDAQNYMELGTIDKKAQKSGWIARYLESEKAGAAPLPAASIGTLLPTSLQDFSKAFSIADLGRLNLGGKPNLQEWQQATLAAMYAGGSSWLHEAGAEALRSLLTLQNAGKSNAAGKAPDYPKSELANRLRTLAQVSRMNVGVRVATVDMGGWDTHKYQGVGGEGQFARQVEQLSEGVGAFFQDLETNQPALAKRTTVLVMTEFGRRLRENANRGTDHGHGGVFFALGPNVNGGKVYGKWPGLGTEKLYERADLAVTTDYRQILTELMAAHRGNAGTHQVFADFRGTAPLGLMKTLKV